MATVAANQRSSWQRRVSRNAAAALIVFTLLHILCSTFVSARTGIGGIGLIAVAILVGLVIPALARFEARWRAGALGGDEAEIAARFRRERRLLWLGAVSLPFVWTGVLLGIVALIG